VYILINPYLIIYMICHIWCISN